MKPDCDVYEKCFFKDCEKKYVHVCDHCTRNKKADKDSKGEDYFTKLQRDGY